MARTRKQTNKKFEDKTIFKAGYYLNAIFPPLNMALMEISRSHFKQSKNASRINDYINLCYGVFCEFLGDFWATEVTVLLKDL